MAARGGRRCVTRKSKNVIASSASVAFCIDCGTAVAPRLLACPACGWLVHTVELKRLAEAAAAASSANEPLTAIVAWREALERVPSDSQQHKLICAEIDKLSRLIDQSGNRTPTSAPSGTTTGEKSLRSKLAALGALLLSAVLKFKVLAFILLTKGKLLLLGLTKGGTLLSMFASLGLYWTAWGWKFAAGFVASLYVHEMGHVAALARYGIRASAPMFLPGLGAVVRMHQAPASPREDARVGLAGPIWGTAAAFLCLGVFLVMKWPLFAALAHTGALLNLFNLAPIWQLDGARAFRALSRWQRWLAAVVVLAVTLGAHQPFLVIVAVTSVLAALQRDAAAEADRTVLLQYVTLVAVLGALSLVPVPGSSPL